MAETALVKIARIEELVRGLSKNVEDRMDSLEHRLFGNGQQGVIADLEENQRKIREELDRKHEESTNRISEIAASQAEQSKFVGRLLGKPGLITAGVWMLLSLLLSSGVIDVKTFVKAMFH